jgi:hypothetical protein
MYNVSKKCGNAGMTGNGMYVQRFYMACNWVGVRFTVCATRGPEFAARHIWDYVSIWQHLAIGLCACLCFAICVVIQRMVLVAGLGGV